MATRRRGSSKDAPVEVPGGTAALTPEETKAGEKKKTKMITRLKFGTPLIGFFFLLVHLGHVYMVGLVVVLQVGLFRELVNVRYKPAKEKMVPLFRTCQWSMFWTSMSHVYGRVFIQLRLAHSAMEQLPPNLARMMEWSIHYYRMGSFTLYIATFCGLVLSLRPGLYKYQIGNTVWTVGVLALVVWQINGITELIYNGMCWFMLPCGLVVANDCWAYFCGVAAGKRFIKAPFLALSPNKTWEGFIGAFPLTVIWAFFYSGWISNSPWLICRQMTFDPFLQHELSCEPNELYRMQAIDLPFAECPFTFRLHCKPFQIHAVVLAMFASVVAPFGGFFASAIKRAYNIKDFDSLIPGHGGVMDRMDCQFLMLLCTYVHYRTFVQVRIDVFSEDDIFSIIRDMPADSRANLMQRLIANFT